MVKKIISLILTLFVVFYNQKALANHKRPHLTVWIHGTTLRAAVPFKSSLIHPQIKFIHFKDLNRGCQTFFRATTLSQADRDTFDLNGFYLFRWSGMLDHDERQLASQHLSQALTKKVHEIELQTGQKPFVTLIGHSHGGNVALNLTLFNQALTIDRLILLACPVQDKTAPFVNHQMFNEVYAFYADNDWVQVLDLQNFNKFSGRSFSLFSNKVIHVKTVFQYNSTADLKDLCFVHNAFMGLSFLAKLPICLKQLKTDLSMPNAAKHYLLRI